MQKRIDDTKISSFVDKSTLNLVQQNLHSSKKTLNARRTLSSVQSIYRLKECKNKDLNIFLP